MNHNLAWCLVAFTHAVLHRDEAQSFSEPANMQTKVLLRKVASAIWKYLSLKKAFNVLCQNLNWVDIILPLNKNNAFDLAISGDNYYVNLNKIVSCRFSVAATIQLNIFFTDAGVLIMDSFSLS